MTVCHLNNENALSIFCDVFRYIMISVRGHAVAQLVEALRYKPEGRGFDSRWCRLEFFIDIILGSTQPLTEKSTRNISWGVKAACA